MRAICKRLSYPLVFFAVVFACGEDDGPINNPTPIRGTPPETNLFSVSSPANNAVNQNLLTNPLILFSQKIDVEITDKASTFKLAIDEASLTGAGSAVEVSLEWTAAKDSLILVHEDLLKPLTAYTISVKTHWEEKQADGTWKPYAVDGETKFVTQTSTFTTADGDLTRILPDNIRAAYPVPHQLNFLKSEYPKGYVMLAHNRQNYLFETSSGATQFALVARFTTPGRAPIDVTLTFDESSLTVAHDMPAEFLNETIYKLQYLKIEGGSTTEQELYAVHFRTSKFNTFAERMTDYTLATTAYWEREIGIIELYRRADNQTEFFDDAETSVDSIGDGKTDHYYYSIGLIQFEVVPGGEWYDQKLYPLLYEGIETSGLLENYLKYVKRKPTLKMPPVNGLLLWRLGTGSEEPFDRFPKLTESDIQNNLVNPTDARAKFVYNVGPIAGYEYLRLRGMSVAPTAPQNSYTERLKAAETRFPSFIPGDYPVMMKYVLPGMTEPTSEIPLMFKLG